MIGLLPPTFESSRRPDQVVGTSLFHHFLGPNDLAWLGLLTAEPLGAEEARAIAFVREIGVTRLQSILDAVLWRAQAAQVGLSRNNRLGEHFRVMDAEADRCGGTYKRQIGKTLGRFRRHRCCLRWESIDRNLKAKPALFKLDDWGCGH